MITSALIWWGSLNQAGHLIADLVTAQGGGLPNPTPQAPPGSEQILKFLNYVKWGAGVAIMVGFFAGIVVWAGGRWVDHHRAGRIGTTMILASLGGAFLYSVGWTMVSGFAGSR